MPPVSIPLVLVKENAGEVCAAEPEITTGEAEIRNAVPTNFAGTTEVIEAEPTPVLNKGACQVKQLIASTSEICEAEPEMESTQESASRSSEEDGHVAVNGEDLAVATHALHVDGDALQAPAPLSYVVDTTIGAQDASATLDADLADESKKESPIVTEAKLILLRLVSMKTCWFVQCRGSRTVS